MAWGGTKPERYLLRFNICGNIYCSHTGAVRFVPIRVAAISDVSRGTARLLWQDQGARGCGNSPDVPCHTDFGYEKPHRSDAPISVAECVILIPVAVLAAVVLICFGIAEFAVTRVGRGVSNLERLFGSHSDARPTTDARLVAAAFLETAAPPGANLARFIC